MSPAGSFLEAMARASRARAERLALHASRARLEALARAAPAAPPLTLSSSGFDLLAEIKFASPSAGALAPASGSAEAARRARSYAGAGAAGISVLTEPTRFAGALEHLRRAARAADVPVMRKDFLVDPLQVLEARAGGAGGVLLIVRILRDAELTRLREEALALGLFVLLEAFDERDLERAARQADAHGGASPCLVGVNARDLVSLAVDRERLLALAPRLPRAFPCVAESGIETPADARAAAEAGYALALVGSALMRAADPGAHARALLAAGRTRGGSP